LSHGATRQSAQSNNRLHHLGGGVRLKQHDYTVLELNMEFTWFGRHNLYIAQAVSTSLLRPCELEQHFEPGTYSRGRMCVCHLFVCVQLVTLVRPARIYSEFSVNFRCRL
jgi:hypothetical protein